jgi:hypothetical protein
MILKKLLLAAAFLRRLQQNNFDFVGFNTLPQVTENFIITPILLSIDLCILAMRF